MKALITGSNGMLGQALKRKLGGGHFYHKREHCDLTSRDAYWILKDILESKDLGIDTVIHCAARVGGVGYNMGHNEEFFKDNIRIDRNVLDAALQAKTPNFLSVLSTCIFPDNATYPLTYNQIDNGPPHSSNYGYSYAKRLLYYETQMFRNFSKNNYLNIIPNNLYGPHDNFNLDKSHIIPALIRKCYESKKNNTVFEVWGDGSPLRQFLYVDDLADIIIWSLENWKDGVPIMAINPPEHSVKEIALTIAEIMGLQKDKIIFDTSKPAGQFRKPAATDFPDWKFTPMREGLEKTIEWFINNYDDARL